MSEENIVQAVVQKKRIQQFAIAGIFLAVAFILPLFRLAIFAAHDELFSYILLIPIVSLYLASLLRHKLPADSSPETKWAAVFFVAGALALAGRFLKSSPSVAGELALPVLAFILFLTGLGFLILGGAMMRVLAFPFGMLIFMVPFPDAMRNAIETGLQYGSAFCAGWMFTLSGMTFGQDGLLFQLPTITLQVAPECSGIHSTVVLFIVSLVAGHFFLRKKWARAVLCLAVLPLALLRNGFRVYVLGELCTHIGPEMIDSPIHHRGGPIFFALSLIPFALLLYFLMKSGRPKNSEPPPNPKN